MVRKSEEGPENWRRKARAEEFRSRIHPDPWHDSGLDLSFMMPDPALNRWSQTPRPSASSAEPGARHSPCQAIERLSLALLHSDSCLAILQAAAQRMRQSLDLQAVLIWELDSRGSELSLRASAGLTCLPHKALPRVKVRLSATGAALSVVRRESLFLPDSLGSSLTDAMKQRDLEEDCGALFASPLTAQGDILGAIEFIGQADDTAFCHLGELMERLTLLTAMGLKRARHFEEMERQAALDPLTGLANQRTAREFLSSRISECRRAGKPLAALVIDVDHFRQFNEELGHHEGDRVLKEVAEVLKRSIRPYDLAGRIGGEEFLVVLPSADEQDSVGIAARIRERIASLRARRGCQVTASIGVALYPECAESPEALLKLADRALYRAKRLGRNQVCLSTWQDQSDARDLSDLVVSLTSPESQTSVLIALADAEGQLELVKEKLGLRLGHMDLIRASLAFLAAAQLDGLTGRMADEAESGELRAVQSLVEQALEGRPSSRASVALAETLKSLNDGRFGPISRGRSPHQAPAA